MNAGSNDTERPGIDAIFCAAIELDSADQRSAWLDQACHGNAELRRQVDRLLRAHFGAGNFLKSVDPAAPAPTILTHEVAERPGTEIGPYKLLEQIGDGGFGVVYMAEQSRPVRRKWPSRSSSPAWTLARSSPASKPSGRRWR
jgi:eukaryotic-like serine/threonine-protein kinase